MGLTRVEADVANPLEANRRGQVTFLVDSGAVYSVMPAEELEKLGIQPSGERTFFLANGHPVKRRIGEVRVTFQGQSATCVVLFGEEGDHTLMGVTTLENLGLIFDPMRQKIIPLPMLLAELQKYFPSNNNLCLGYKDLDCPAIGSEALRTELAYMGLNRRGHVGQRLLVGIPLRHDHALHPERIGDIAVLSVFDDDLDAAGFAFFCCFHGESLA